MSREAAYGYINRLRSLYIPRTPSAALQAVGEDILPIEAFIYKSTALNPILKKPYNLDEIEWLLSRKNRDLQTNLILKTVLSEISRDEDKEIALFAAESLNAIEKEYNSRLTALKSDIKKYNRPGDRAQAGEIYYHLALLNHDESTLSNFYMKEAFLLLDSLIREEEAADEDRNLLIRVLLYLKLYTQAEQILPETKESRIFRLEIAYLRKDIHRVREILAEMESDPDTGNTEKGILEFWTGRNE